MAANGAGANGAAPPLRTELVGFQGFTRSNPRTDRFEVRGFHHVEFWCGDATNAARRFAAGLGMAPVARSDQGTGNQHCASHVLQSGELVFAFTAPYGVDGSAEGRARAAKAPPPPLPWYDAAAAHAFHARHGLAVRALGVAVADAAAAYAAALRGGGRGVTPPAALADAGGAAVVAEVELYGDVVLRLVSGDHAGPFLPGYERLAPAGAPAPPGYGLRRLDHAVGNVPELLPVANYVAGFTGFHEFAEFVAADVGTVDSGLNSVVLASNDEMVLLPINEPTHGTRRKSQIQTFLEQNLGPGLQHLALKTDDIFGTLRAMRAAAAAGAGFDFMPPPSDGYYAALPAKIGRDVLTPAQYAECEELGVLVDRDDQGVLLQIFTRPLGDRPTVFIEIIQRLCLVPPPAPSAEAAAAAAAAAAKAAAAAAAAAEVGGCGGFGKGNFTELFKSIEVYETNLGINQVEQRPAAA